MSFVRERIRWTSGRWTPLKLPNGLTSPKLITSKKMTSGFMPIWYLEGKEKNKRESVSERERERKSREKEKCGTKRE